MGRGVEGLTCTLFDASRVFSMAMTNGDSCSSGSSISRVTMSNGTFRPPSARRARTSRVFRGFEVTNVTSNLFCVVLGAVCVGLVLVIAMVAWAGSARPRLEGNGGLAGAGPTNAHEDGAIAQDTSSTINTTTPGTSSSPCPLILAGEDRSLLRPRCRIIEKYAGVEPFRCRRCLF